MPVQVSVLGAVAAALLVAAIVAFIATPVVRSLAFKIGAVDVPKDNRRMHNHPIPRMGGLAIFFGFILSAMIFVPLSTPVRGMLLGGVILGLLSRVWTQEVTLDAQTVMGILLIGVVGTAMAFTLYLQGVNDIGPVKTSLLSCAELVTAGVLTSVWLKTPLAWQDVLGMALILGMVAFLAVPGRTTPNTTRSNS